MGRDIHIGIPTRSEASIEAAACAAITAEWPKARIRKLNGGGQRGWPDRLVCLPGGIVVFIEFKKPGGSVRPDQGLTITELRKLGCLVAVCQSIEETLYACQQAIDRLSQA